MAAAADALSREERIAELWRRGRLRWKLYPDQREVYDAVRGFLDSPDTRFEQFFVDISRQWGKTFLGVLLATEDAIRNPGWSIGYTAATRTALWQFIQPNMDVLLADCPDDLRPRWNSLTSDYVFPNGSTIHLAGVNNGHENDARGPRRHAIYNEEFGFVDRPDYLVKSIELPMLTTTGGRIVHITTPAETPAHESTAYKIRCRTKGHYIKRTIDDNRHLSEEAKAKLIEEAGGPESTTCRRELRCEDVVDETRAAVPEFSVHKAGIVRPVSMPECFFPLVAMDVGFKPDPTHALFGAWDFRRAKLVVKAEFYETNALTDVIAAGVKEREAALWPWSLREMERNEHGRHTVEPWRKERRPTYRYSDTDLRLIADLSAMHKLTFAPTAKDNKEAQVNELRMFVKDERVEIDPACVHLIASLETTLWNRQRTEWERTSLGHGDGVDALLYMLRNAPRHVNPYPPKYAHLDPRLHLLPVEPDEAPATPASRAVASIFGRH